jgi:hypothetical protein
MVYTRGTAGILWTCGPRPGLNLTAKRYLVESSPENSQIMHHLASLLVPQEIFPQSLVIVDTRLLRKFPCEINILRDLGADL